MKIRELKENESLEVIEVTMKPNNTDIFDSVLSDSDTGEYSRIKMRILTDGEIERQTEEISQDINEFYIGENKYQFDVNTLKTKIANIFRVTRDFRMTLIVCFVIVLCIVCQTVPEVRPT